MHPNEVPVCESKHKFKRRETAAIYATTLGLYSYKCQVCGYWHLTGKKADGQPPAKLVPMWARTRPDDPHYKVKPNLKAR